MDVRNLSDYKCGNLDAYTDENLSDGLVCVRKSMLTSNAYWSEQKLLLNCNRYSIMKPKSSTNCGTFGSISLLNFS